MLRSALLALVALFWALPAGGSSRHDMVQFTGNGTAYEMVVTFTKAQWTRWGVAAKYCTAACPPHPTAAKIAELEALTLGHFRPMSGTRTITLRGRPFGVVAIISATSQGSCYARIGHHSVRRRVVTYIASCLVVN